MSRDAPAHLLCGVETILARRQRLIVTSTCHQQSRCESHALAVDLTSSSTSQISSHRVLGKKLTSPSPNQNGNLRCQGLSVHEGSARGVKSGPDPSWLSQLDRRQVPYVHYQSLGPRKSAHKCGDYGISWAQLGTAPQSRSIRVPTPAIRIASRPSTVGTRERYIWRQEILPRWLRSAQPHLRRAVVVVSTAFSSASPESRRRRPLQATVGYEWELCVCFICSIGQ